MGYIVGEVTGRLEDGRPSEIKPYDLSALYGDTLTFGEASAYLLNADREDKQNGILDAPEMVVVTEQALANVTEQRPELTVSMSSKDSPVLIDRFLKASSEEWKLQTDHGGMHGEHSDKPSVYFDIDGTLGKWYADGRGYSSLEEIIDPENHYFRDIEPHPFMVQLAQHLQEEGYDVCVISAADRDTIRDKMEWVQKNLPFVPEENVFFSPLGADKTKFIKDNAEISVLIDDYNVNLEAWTGKAIKAINTVNSHQDKYAEIDMTVPERMLERHEQRKAEVEQMIEEGWLPETAAEDIKTSFAESMANHIMRATEVVAEAVGEAVRENVIKKTNDVPLQVFEQIKKAAQELEEAPVDGKYFGYDIHDIEEALKTEEGTTKFIDKLYEIDSSFGADPMYFGVEPAPLMEQFLKNNGYGLEYDREMRLEEIEHEEEMRLHYTDSEKVEGLRLEMYNDGSGSATLNGERIAEVDLMTREYKLSRPNKETGKPEFDTGYDYDIDLDKATFLKIAEDLAIERYGAKMNEPEITVDQAEKFEKIADMSESSDYVRSGMVATHSNHTAYTHDSNTDKYYAIHTEYDDIVDTEEPYVTEVTYDDIVEALADVEEHKDLFSDLYSGGYDQIADDVRHSEIYDEGLEMDVHQCVSERWGEIYRPDIRSAIEEKWGSEVAEAIPEELLKEIISDYSAKYIENRENTEEWDKIKKTVAEEIIGKYEEEIGAADMSRADTERSNQGMVMKEEGGYSVNGQHIDEFAARELVNFIDMENYREDIRSVIEEQYGDVVADAVSDDLLNKVTQTYADNRGDGEEWRTYAENAVSEFRTEIESAGREQEAGKVEPVRPYVSDRESTGDVKLPEYSGFDITTSDSSTVRIITGEDGRETRPRMFTQELGTQPKYFGEGAKLGEKAEGEALEILSSLPDSSVVPANVREWAKEALATANEMIQKMEENGFKTIEMETAIGTIAIEPFVQQGLGRDAQNIGEIEGYSTDSDVIQGGGSSIYGYAQEIVNAAELQREAFKDKVDLQEFYDSKVFPIKDIPYENLNEEQHNTLSFYSDWHKDNYGIRPHDESRDMCYQTHMRHEAQKEEAMKTDITQYVMSIEEPMFSDEEVQSVNFSMPMYDEGLKNMLDRTALLDKSFDYNTFDDVVNSDFDTLNAYVDTFLDENGKVQANATIELSGERVTLEASVPLTEAEAQKLVELAEQEFAKDGSRSLETALKEENAKATERVFESEKIEGLKVHVREDNTGVIERNGKGLYKFDLDKGTISNYLSPTTDGNLENFGIESAEDMLPLAETLVVQVTQSKTVEGLSFHTFIDDHMGYATLNGEKFMEYDLYEGDTNFQNKGWEKWGTTDMEKLAHFAETYAVNNLGAQEIQSPMKWFEPEKYEPECLEADGNKYNFNLYVGDNTETAMGMFVEATAVVDRKSGEISVSIDNEGQCFTRDENYNETFYPIPEDVAESVVDKVRECTIDEVVKDILKEEKADHPDGYTYDYWGQGAEIDDSMMNEAVQDFVKQMHEHNGEYASAPSYDTPDFKDYLTSKVVSEWQLDMYEEENIREAFSYGKTQGEMNIINEYVENHGLSGVSELLNENDLYMEYDISSIVGEHQMTLYLATSNEVNHDSSIISTMCNNEGLQALDKQLSERTPEDVDHHFDSALTYMVYAMGQDMTTVMQEHYGVKESGNEFVQQVAEAFNEMSPNSNAELAICVKLDNDSLDLITQIGKQDGYITVPEGTEMHLFDRLNGYESDEIRNPEPFTFSAADADWQSKHQVAEINVVQVYDKHHRDGYADCQLDSDDYPRDLKSATKAEGEPAEIADKAQKIADAMHGDIPNVKESISNDVKAMEAKEKTDKTKKATDDFGNR